MPASTQTPQTLDLQAAAVRLDGASAEDVVHFAAEHFGDGAIMTSSFGIQAAVMLHLCTRQLPDIPVWFIDTGFHFPETYRFVDELTQRLSLNLTVLQPELSPAWMVARHGQLWEQGDRKALDLYDQIRKVAPMQKALEQRRPTAWLAGLRAKQTDHRASLPRLEEQQGVVKLYPILHWSQKEVWDYLKKHDLPPHPLHDKGYPSIGDWHSTRSILQGEDDRAGRFNGLKQECGLHLPATEDEAASRDASML